MNVNQTDYESSDARIVETLFGPVAEKEIPFDYKKETEEELPHYFFDGRYDARQADLPLIQVNHYQPKILFRENVSDLIPFLDELALFEKRWGFLKQAENREGWCHRVEMEAVPILTKMTELCRQNQLLQPRAVYSYLFCTAKDNMLYLYKENKSEIFLEIEFPRLKNGVCLTDRLAEKDSGMFDTVAAIAVNMGRNATETCKSWLALGKDEDYKYLHGFALEMLNAMTQYAGYVISSEECCGGDVVSLGNAKQGAARVQSALIKMLKAESIDIAFGNNHQMVPEYSSLALVLPR